MLSGLIASASSAHAHPDLMVVEEKGLLVPPGGFVDFPMSVHYHWVVGRFQVTDPTDATVTLHVMDDPSFRGYTPGQLAPALYSSSGSGNALNFLIACCDEAYWTTYHLVIENADPTASRTVRVQVILVHDGGAAGEWGTGGPAFLVAVGAFLALDLFHSGRRAAPKATGRTSHRPAYLETEVPESRHAIALYSLSSFAIFGAVIALGLGVLLVGLRTYGGDPKAGLVGGAAEVSLSLGLFESALYFLAALTVLPWILALFLWGRAFALTARTGSRFVGGLGVGAGLVTLLVGVLIASASGSVLVPMLVAGVFGLPQLAAGGLLLARARMRWPSASPRD